MSDPTERALTLLSCLTARSGWTGPELAEYLQITSRSVRRDIDRLRALGYDIESTSGLRGGYRLRSGTVTPPLFLQPDEAVVIATALAFAARDGAEGFGATAARALAKLHHTLPPATVGPMDAVRSTIRTVGRSGDLGVDAHHLAVLAECCRDRIATTFGYSTKGGQSSTRRVEPNTLVATPAAWYLLGYDLDRQDWRTFRLDRLTTSPVQSAHRYPARDVPGGDPIAFVFDRIASVPQPHTASVYLAVARDTVLRARPRLIASRVRRVDATSAVVHLGGSDAAGLVTQVVDLFQVGPVTRIEATDELRQRLVGVAGALGACDARASVAREGEQ